MNIAMGYGLAVYVDRHFGTLVFALPNLGRLRQANLAASASPTKVESGVPAASTAKPSAPQTAAVVAPPFDSGATPKDATVEAAAVDEGNVLAGIEEFRSQLAKMNASEPNSESAVAGATG